MRNCFWRAILASHAVSATGAEDRLARIAATEIRSPRTRTPAIEKKMGGATGVRQSGIARTPSSVLRTRADARGRGIEIGFGNAGAAGTAAAPAAAGAATVPWGFARKTGRGFCVAGLACGNGISMVGIRS